MPDVHDVREIIPARTVRVAPPVPASRPSGSPSGRLSWHQVELHRSYLTLLLPTRDDSSCDCVRHHSRHHLESHNAAYRRLSLSIDTHERSRSLTITGPKVVIAGSRRWRAPSPSAVVRVLFEHPETVLGSWNAPAGASERCSSYIPGLRLDKEPLPSLLCNKRTTTTQGDEDSKACRSLKTQLRTSGQVSSRTSSTSPPAPCAGGVPQDVDRASSGKAGSSGIAQKMSISGHAATELHARDDRRGGTPCQGRTAASDGSAERDAALDPLATRPTLLREVPVPYTTLALARAPQATIRMVNSTTSSMISPTRTPR
jgi:hypothetical protein